jgi:hypothetical protein
LAKAITSVEGAKVVTAPKRGEGEMGRTVAVVELSGKATLGAVTKALEMAATPHKDKTAPGVAAAVSTKLGDDGIEKLMKLLEEK